MHHSTLVCAATNQVYGDGDPSTSPSVRGQILSSSTRHSHHTEDTPRPQPVDIGTSGYATASGGSPNLEKVSAGVHRPDEGYSRLRGKAIAVAEEGNECRFVAGFVRTRRAVGVVQNEFAPAEEGVSCLLATRSVSSNFPTPSSTPEGCFSTGVPY